MRFLFFTALIVLLSTPVCFASDDTADEGWQTLYDAMLTLSKAADFDSAIVVGSRALDLVSERFGANDTLVAKVSYKLGIACYRRGEYDHCEQLMRDALRIGELGFPPDHRNIGSYLNGLGLALMAQGKYAEAEEFYLKSVQFKKRTLGSDDLGVTSSLSNLAGLYILQAKYAEAESLQQRILEIREAALGPDDPAVARILLNMAALKMESSQYGPVEAMLLRAHEILSRALGDDHLEVAWAVGNLANFYFETGRYDLAAPLYRQALATWERAEDPLVWIAYLGLALTHYREGDYAQAEPLFERAAESIARHQGEKHPDMALTLGRQANLYSAMGRYDEAERCFRRALEITRTTFGADNPKVALVLNNLAFLLTTQKRFSEAEPLLEEALGIYEQSFGGEHWRVADALESLAQLYTAQRRFDKAAIYMSRGVASLKAAVGPNHPNLAYYLTSEADLLRYTGQLDQAEADLRAALEIETGSHGEHHPDLARTRESLSSLQRQRGQTDLALLSAGKAFETRWRNFIDNNTILSEHDAIRYSQLMRHSAGNYLSCYIDARTSEEKANRGAARVVITSKGQVTEAVFERRRSLASESDSATAALTASYRQARRRLAESYASHTDPESFAHGLDSLTTEVRDLERELAARSTDFRQRQHQAQIELSEIVRELPERSTLIEYLRFQYVHPDSDSISARYLAVVTSSDGFWHVVKLGSAERLDHLVQRYRTHIQNVAIPPSPIDQMEYTDLGRDLYDFVLAPLEGFIEDADLLLIAPDAALNLVSFAGLIDKEAKYVVESRAVHYLTSARELARLHRETHETGTGLLAMGDPDYDAPAATRLGITVWDGSSSAQSADTTQTRSGLSGCDRLAELVVTPLPGTRNEIEKISARWQEIRGESAVVFMGAAAGEENFERHAAGRRVIHLATHGYYLERTCQPMSDDGTRQSLRGSTDFPLLSSGLLLAGSNLHGEGSELPGAADGVLTAEEVAAMDLRGTELVVLSACETGLGDVQDGEGVYGLRRAFQLAGVRTVMSALWSVPDRFTADLMGQLYGHLETDNLPATVAHAQRTALSELRQAGRPDHPASWAAFITLGDWRFDR